MANTLGWKQPRKIVRSGFVIFRSSRLWKRMRVPKQPREFAFNRSSGLMLSGKFTDFHGNVWPLCGDLPTTNRGGLFR